MTKILGGCTFIDMVESYVNHSAKREEIHFLRKMCGSSVEGVRERFAIQKHKNGDGSILCNRLATLRKEERVGYVMLKNKIGTNCDFNTKMVMPF